MAFAPAGGRCLPAVATRRQARNPRCPQLGGRPASGCYDTCVLAFLAAALLTLSSLTGAGPSPALGGASGVANRRGWAPFTRAAGPQHLTAPPPARRQSRTQNNLRLLRWLADHGSAQGAYGLGVAYDQGRGVRQSYARAAHWYRIAAQRGWAKAQLSLAVMYQLGQGVARSNAHAVKWYRRAAKQGLADAQASLAALYASGEGVAKNIPAAKRWYRQAARQGSADAQLNLAELEIGPPPGRDYPGAAHWLRLLARGGNALAQRWLGDLYAAGHGVPRNPRRAYLWYWLAGRQSKTAAARARELGRRLSAAQRRAARREAQAILAPRKEAKKP